MGCGLMARHLTVNQEDEGSSPSVPADLDVIFDMAKSLESIARLSRELQEEVLERIASGTADVCSVELDGIIYDIPEVVFAPINGLVSQVQELSNLDEIPGHQGN